MLPYLIIALLIVLLAIFDNGKKKKILIIIAFFALALFAGLRGNFTSDYNSYCDLFLQANSFGSLKELIQTPIYTENGFMIIMYLFGRVINSPVAFIVFMSAVTVLLFFYEIFRSSELPWLSILLLIGVGTYYDSFNISRYILATAIMFACARFIIEKKFVKFLIAVLLAMNIHRMIIVMIPMYFLLNVKISRISVFLTTIAGIVLVSALPLFINLFQYLFPVYNNYFFGMEGGSWKPLVVPVSVLMFVLFYLRFNKKILNFDVSIPQNKILVNALIYQIIFTLCSLRIYMAIRVTFLFSPYLCILVSNVINQIKDTKRKRIWILIVGICAIVYPLVVYSNTGYDPYFTIFGAS